MKKTLGQIAAESFYGSTAGWSGGGSEERNRWEAAALAVALEVDENYLCKLAFAEGKKIQQRLKGYLNWSYTDMPLWTSDCEYRIAPEPPWQLPAPPAGRQWHRTDWTADMLPDGWRPLLAGEAITHKEQCRSQRIGAEWGPWMTDGIGRKEDFHFRTRRPLPPFHSITFTLPPLKLQAGNFSFASA